MKILSFMARTWIFQVMMSARLRPNGATTGARGQSPSIMYLATTAVSFFTRIGTKLATFTHLIMAGVTPAELMVRTRTHYPGPSVPGAI